MWTARRFWPSTVSQEGVRAKYFIQCRMHFPLAAESMRAIDRSIDRQGAHPLKSQSEFATVYYSSVVSTKFILG
eukprot:scaffold92049_cov32-Tisochrysis_lutea.AAC.1